MTNPSAPASLCTTLAVLAVVGCAATCQAAEAATAEREFDLPADRASKTLRLFAEQAAVEVIFASEFVAQVHTRALQGRHAPEEALRRLLADTGLVADRNPRTGAFLVRRLAPQAPPRAPPRETSPAPPPAPPKTAQPQFKESPPVKNRTLIALLTGWLLATAPAANAQSTGTIEGRVVDASTQLALEAARIEVKGQKLETYTDRFGQYRFEGLPSGGAVLVARYPGLASTELAVDVRQSTVTRGDINLDSSIYKLDAFVVRSEREGNAQAIALQRQSDGVRNIVSSDAFGGLAGNPADLVSRLPGIQGDTNNGDMRYIIIRGLNQNLNAVTQDGNRLADAASAGSTREFQFETISADTIERIEVTKSPTPDLDADGIGGVVNLVTKSAFDSKVPRRITASVGAAYRADRREGHPQPNASFSYAEVFDGRFGVSVNLAFRKHSVLTDGSTQGHQQLAAGVDGPAYQYSQVFGDSRLVRARTGIGLKFDYKLNENTRFFISLQENKHTEHQDFTQVTAQTNQGIATVDANGNFTGTNGIEPGFTDYETRARPVANSTMAVSLGTIFKIGVTRNLNIGAVHRVGELELDYNLYLSRSKANYPGNNTLTYTMRGVGFSLRKDNPQYPTLRQTGGPDWSKIENYTDNLYSSTRSVGWDGYRGGAINLRKTLSLSVPTYIKTGLKLRQQTRKLDNTPYRAAYFGPDGVMGPNAANGGRNDDNLAQFGSVEWSEYDTGPSRYGSLPVPAAQAVGRSHDMGRFIAATPSYFSQQLANDLQAAYINHQLFKESIGAAYVMGNVRIGRATILAGVRMEDTRTEGEGALQVITPEEKARRAAWGTAPLTAAEITRRTDEEFGRRQSKSGKYQTVFPSAHVKYELTSSLLLRFSYGTSIGRPGIGALIPRTTVNYDNMTVSTSNLKLEPQTAQNFDLAAEYYFEPAGLFSAGVFQKNIKKFIYNAGGTVIGTGADNGFDGDYAGYTLSTQANGGSAKTRGLEVSYGQQFTFLPGLLKGFGAFANFTRMLTEGNFGSGGAIALTPSPRIAGFNPFVANAGISYIRIPVNLRLNFTYKGRYLTTYNANESRAVYQQPRRQLDFKTQYNFSKTLSAYFDVVYIVNQFDRQQVFGFGRPQQTIKISPQLLFGINTRL